MKSIVLPLALFISVASLAFAEPDATVQPIVEVAGVKPNNDAFGRAAEPHKVTSVEDAAKLFGEDAVNSLKEKVDFEKQIVLVFAWRGSGQDQLTFDVAESFPEQVYFKLRPGRTRDLRPHVRVFALRNDVKWKVADGR